MTFETIIGLEVHVQLNTATKIFCSCKTSFGDMPNTNICPVCLGLPGALPVLNKQAVSKAISLGTAINAKINQNSIFARKNYFYPDLPKGYQISQFELPIVSDGKIEIQTQQGLKTIGITRAHLEEDAGKNIHDINESRVDLNRAGTPLLEIVSEPDLRSSFEALSYLKKLHSIVRCLKISDANMQEGSFRCDANVSIRPKGENKFYTRVEIKNLNSFKFIQKAIDYEVARQTRAWLDGKYNDEVVQETRLFDSAKNITKSMRGKEESADYRYFLDPDLLPLYIEDALLKEGKNIQELPDQKLRRYIDELGLRENEAISILQEIDLVEFFEELIESKISPKMAFTWLMVELLGNLKGDNDLSSCGVSPSLLAELIQKIDSKEISSKSAKDILAHLVENKGGDINALIKDMGLAQISDDSVIVEAIKGILDSNIDKVNEYKNGKDKLFGFFVGQVMKNLKGANPNKVNEILKAQLQSY